MTGRLDHVTIPLSRGDVAIPLDSRQQLLAQLRHLGSAKETVDAFDAVGANLPVSLTTDSKDCSSS